MKTYKIIRFYAKEGKKSKIRFRGLSLEEAKKHCSRKDTRRDGEWFDGYTIEAPLEV